MWNEPTFYRKTGNLTMFPAVQEIRKEVGCQWESPYEEMKKKETREVGCQSDSAEQRDAAVQVDLLTQQLSWRHTGAAWQCVRVEDPGLLQHHSPPLHLFCCPPTMYQPTALKELPWLPSMPQCSEPPPGLIAPLSPRLAEEEEEEEEDQRLCAERWGQITSVKKRRKKGSAKWTNHIAARARWKRSEDRKEIGQSEEMSRKRGQIPGGGEEEEGMKKKVVKMNSWETERPRRTAVRPPIRYLVESEVTNHRTVRRREERQEDEEEIKDSRVESLEDGCWKICKVCGLNITCAASPQLHLSVHRPFFNKPRPPVTNKTPDWSRRREPKIPRWWVDYRSTKRMKKRRRRKRREEDKQVCVKEEGGGEEEERRDGGEIEKKVEGGGEDGVMKRRDEEGKEEEEVGDERGKRRKYGGEIEVCIEEEEEGGGEKKEEGGKRKEMKAQLVRPRRQRVGPPIRYLLESEERSHGVVTSNQERAHGPRKRGRPINVMRDQEEGGGTSERQTERQTGDTERQTCERQTGDTERQTCERQTERSTCETNRDTDG
ncbi:trichohyalin-like [Eleginops maclovinus]|uniref:trichohyalin-like n=1 Tax=Eleginops maclovinus TaxID=56733 RepID=UPI0030807043